MQASAGPQETPRGVKAEASASFRSDCFVADTFAVAHAEATDASGTHNIFTQEDPESGSSISSHASASMAGVTNCYSWAQASVSYEGSVYLTPMIENYSCPPPVAVAITGPTVVTTDSYTAPCADVTWTASATGGNGGYTYKWYIDGVLQSSTDPTLPKRFCNRNTPATVQVVATDSAGWSGNATFTTDFNYIDNLAVSVSGPTSINTDYYINAACADVTWTATATGGHSPYTYTWYFDTDPPVQGNPFAKKICSTNKSVTLKVVASDSDGHTATQSLTITIRHIGPVVASISGPTSVTTDYYINSGCADITWTASATGGHPGYTYSWYLGTGTTVQGTGSTFTKSYCNTSQSVTAKVIASDSDGHTDDAAFTTTISNRGAIVAKITGPTSVSSSTSCTTVSWTVSATSTGHSGITYKWYIGTTLQTTTSTTFSKQFCSSGGTSQSATVKATATASDGHQDTDTHTTSITFPPPTLTASISGESEAYVYGTTCYDLFWSANVSGGTPAYTYSWTIGTSTTVLSTTSTLTKRVCTAQTLNVKLTARDSAAHTANATFTTTVVKETACFAQCP
jgi:hypothetical protein